jgi:CTP:molybdopterin cytidylyltransferase MocA
MNLSDKLKSEKRSSAIILAAGTSGRMGYPKAALKFNDDANFVQHLCPQFLISGCEKVIIVINNDTAKLFEENNVSFPKSVSIVINKNPEFGRFYSLQLGLQQCINANSFT